MWIKPRRFNTLHYGSLGHYERQHRASPDGGWADFEVFRYSGKNLRPLFVLVYDRRFVLAQSDDCDALLAAEWKYATEKLPLLAAAAQPPLATSKQREKWLCKRVAAIAQSVLALVKGRAPPPQQPPVPVSPAAALPAEDDEWEFTDDEEGPVTVATVSADPALAPASPALTAPPSPVPPGPPAAPPVAPAVAPAVGGRERSRSNSSPMPFVASSSSAPASAPMSESDRRVDGQPSQQAQQQQQPLLPGEGAPETGLSLSSSASASPAMTRHHSERRAQARAAAAAAGAGTTDPCADANEIFFSPPSASSGSVTHTASGLIHRMTKRKGNNAAVATAASSSSGASSGQVSAGPATPVPTRRGCTPVAGAPAGDESAPEGSVTPVAPAPQVESNNNSSNTSATATAQTKETDTGLGAKIAEMWEQLRATALFVTYVEPWVEAFREECPTSKQRTRRYIVVGCSVLTGVLLLAYMSNSVMLCLELLVLNAALVEAIRNRAAVVRYLCRTKVSHSTTRGKKRFLRSWHKPHLHKKDTSTPAPAPPPAAASSAPAPVAQSKAAGAAPPVAEEPCESSDEDEMIVSMLSDSDD